MNLVEELEQRVRSALESAGPSVVSIGRHGRGTGFVIGVGRVLTNAHNVRDRTTQVRFADGRAVQGSVQGIDVDGDLVVLDVDTGEAPTLAWADATVQVGDTVLAVSAGQHQVRVTWGQVSSADRGFRGPRGRPIRGAIEHTAPAARGSSGAPLLDRDGRVVGVNTHRLEHGFYLARSADETLRGSVAAMQEGRRVEQVRLGVALAPSPVAQRLRHAVGLPKAEGVLVRGVVDGSPAAQAGIAVGDLLTSAAGRPLATPDDVFAVLGGLAPGGDLAIELIRGSESSTVTVTFPEASADS